MAELRLVKVFVAFAGLVVMSISPAIAVAASGTKSPSSVSFRPVLCFATTLDSLKMPAISSSLSTSPMACASSYRLSAKNLDVRQTSNTVTGYTMRTIGPDPQYRNTPDTPTSKIRVNSVALVSGIKGDGVLERYVVGPAQLTDSSIKSAKAEDNSGQWVVTYQLTASGNELWNTFVRRQFHQFIAIVADGHAYSVPLIEPYQSSFTSFAGKGEIGRNFTETQARDLAALM